MLFRSPVLAGKSNCKPAAFSQIRPVNRKKRNVMAYSVRTSDFRYVELPEPDNSNAVIWQELYDHRSDPEETVSVANKQAYADVVKRHETLVSEDYRSLTDGRD